jgi:large subunit ribosomal protein L18
MNTSQKRREGRMHRRRGIRRIVKGSDSRPRVSVFRSNRYLYVQVISDESGKTLAAANTVTATGGSTVAQAGELGKQIAEKCKELSITEVVFDRGGYRYHGRVKALADAAREAGLRF